MAKNLFNDIDRLKKHLLGLGAMVEENLRRALDCLAGMDADIARAVQDKDKQIDETEVNVEEECLRILALHQPVAGDLRFVVTVLKINNDLERIGDLTSKIADKVTLLHKKNLALGLRDMHLPAQLREMFITAIDMVNNSLDSFVHEDVDLAYKVLVWDDAVDGAKHEIRREIEEVIQKDPNQYIYLAMILSMTRSVERIADHATNIAESVIYMMQGRIIRHLPPEIA